MAWNPITGLFDFVEDLRDGTEARRLARQTRHEEALDARADARSAALGRQNLAADSERERRTIRLTQAFAPEVHARMLQQREAEAAIALRAQDNATANAIRVSEATAAAQRLNDDNRAGQLEKQRAHELALTRDAYFGREPFLPQFLGSVERMQASNQAHGLKLAETLKPTTLQQLTPVLTTALALALA